MTWSEERRQVRKRVAYLEVLGRAPDPNQAIDELALLVAHLPEQVTFAQRQRLRIIAREVSRRAAE